MKTIFSLGLLAVLNIALLFLIHWFVLVTVGPGEETDAFFAGMAVPQLILAILGGSLMQVLVPLLSVSEGEHFQRDTWGFFIFVGACLSLIAISLFFLAPLWVPFFVPGFSNTAKVLMIVLTRIQLIGMVFTALSSVLWAVYQSRKYFIWVAFVPVFTNAVSLGGLVWALPRYGITSAAWVGVLGVVLQTLLLIPILGHYRKPDWKSNIYREAWKQVKPLFLGACYYKTDPLVDRLLTSMAPVGGLSLFYLGHQIYGAATQVINKSIVAPVVPLLARNANEENWKTFRDTYQKRLLWIIAVTGLSYFIFLFIGESALKFIFSSRDMSEEHSTLLWWIMVCLVGTFIGGAGAQLTSAAFYTRGDTRTPTKLGVWTYTLYVPIKVWVFMRYGITGLAISTSLYFVVNFLLQVNFLEVFYSKRHEYIQNEAR